MHETREVTTLASRMHRARASDRIGRTRRWLLDYADSGAGQQRVVVAFVDLASGESLALTSGSPDGVWMTGRVAHWLTRPRRRIWSIHNHPEGRSTSPAAGLPSIVDVSMLAHSAIETVEVCTTRGLLTATTVDPEWSRRSACGLRLGRARWTQAMEAAWRLCEGLAATAPVSWPQAHRTAQAATLEALQRANIIRMTCSENLERLWAAHRDGQLLETMRQSIQRELCPLGPRPGDELARFGTCQRLPPRGCGEGPIPRGCTPQPAGQLRR